MVNSGRKFKQKESFTHKLAKELLFQWITESGRCDIQFIDSETKRECCVNWQDFCHMEYPITEEFPYYICETNDCLQTIETNLINCQGCVYREDGYNPCLKCNKFDKTKMLYVADIARAHKGIIALIIEIKHTKTQLV